MNSDPRQHRWVPVLLTAFAILALGASAVILFSSMDSGHHDDADQLPDFHSFSASKADADAPADIAVDDLIALEDLEAWRYIDWQHLARDEQWEPLEPTDTDPQPEPEPDPEPSIDEATASQSPDPPVEPAGSRQQRLRDGRIVIITNFTRADVLVNGEPYPAYSDQGTNDGIAVTPNESHEIYVEFDGNSRIYEVEVRPGERRLMMIELTGMGESRAERPEPRTPRRMEERVDDEDDDDADGEGRITVYSRPRGDIFVDGQEMDEQTPGTVDVEAGRREVQVEYSGGEMSETKTVRVREGSRVKLFFRQEDE